MIVLLCEFPRRISLGWLTNVERCAVLVLVEPQHVRSALDACITLYRYTIRDDGTNGRIILVSPWHLARYTVRRTGSRRIRRIGGENEISFAWHTSCHVLLWYQRPAHRPQACIAY